MLQCGLWPMMRQRPFGTVANPDDTPKAIFVSAFNSMPLSQNFELVLKGQEREFQTGISALAKLAKVHLGISAKQSAKALLEAKDCEVTVFDGPAPAGNVGVQINHVDPINKGEVVWTMGPEEVIFVGRLLLTGKLDLTRTIALAGSEVKFPKCARHRRQRDDGPEDHRRGLPGRTPHGGERHPRGRRQCRNARLDYASPE